MALTNKLTNDDFAVCECFDLAPLLAGGLFLSEFYLAGVRDMAVFKTLLIKWREENKNVTLADFYTNEELLKRLVNLQVNDTHSLAWAFRFIICLMLIDVANRGAACFSEDLSVKLFGRRDVVTDNERVIFNEEFKRAHRVYHPNIFDVSSTIVDLVKEVAQTHEPIMAIKIMHDGDGMFRFFIHTQKHTITNNVELLIAKNILASKLFHNLHEDGGEHAIVPMLIMAAEHGDLLHTKRDLAISFADLEKCLFVMQITDFVPSTGTSKSYLSLQLPWQIKQPFDEVLLISFLRFCE